MEAKIYLQILENKARSNSTEEFGDSSSVVHSLLVLDVCGLARGTGIRAKCPNRF